MDAKKYKQADAETKPKVLNEISETGNVALVARAHDLNYQTVTGWIRAARLAPKKKKAKESKATVQRLLRLELENRILKELLKKTNQAWLRSVVRGIVLHHESKNVKPKE